MEPSKNLYEVQIAGLPLKLRSSHDEQTVNRLVSFVDEKVNESLENGHSSSFQNALLLSALHIAEELILLKENARDEIDGLEKQAQEILSDLESSPISRIRFDN